MMVRLTLGILLLGVLMGCRGNKQNGAVIPSDGRMEAIEREASYKAASPSAAIKGKIASVQTNYRFVVVEFTMDRLPGVGQELDVYRGEQKVGEIRVTGPFRGLNSAADVLRGEVQEGDWVYLPE